MMLLFGAILLEALAFGAVPNSCCAPCTAPWTPLSTEPESRLLPDCSETGMYVGVAAVNGSRFTVRAVDLSTHAAVASSDNVVCFRQLLPRGGQYELRAACDSAAECSLLWGAYCLSPDGCRLFSADALLCATAQGAVCYPPDSVCDGARDCPEGEDEAGCGAAAEHSGGAHGDSQLTTILVLVVGLSVCFSALGCFVWQRQQANAAAEA